MCKTLLKTLINLLNIGFFKNKQCLKVCLKNVENFPIFPQKPHLVKKFYTFMWINHGVLHRVFHIFVENFKIKISRL